MSDFDLSFDLSGRDWNNMVNRAINCPTMQHYYFVGHSADYGTPFYVPRRRRSPHNWVMAMPGAGATSAYVAPQLVQMLAHADTSVVVVASEPCKELYLTCRLECARAGLPFRVLDLTPGRQTHAFNPLTQTHAARQSPMMRVATLMQALGQEFSVGHAGRSWYSSAWERSLADALAKYGLTSFEELARLLQDPNAWRFMDPESWAASGQCRNDVVKLAAYPQLNLTARTPGVAREVLDYAIDMRQIVHQPQALFCVLNFVEARSLSRAAGGLVVHNLLAAAVREEDRRCDVELVLQEAHEFVGPELGMLLNRARGAGVRVTFQHNHLGQLVRSHESDYAEALEAGTGLQVVFAPVSRRTREWVADTGGTVTRPQITWSQTLGGRECDDGDFRLAHADAPPGLPGVLPRASVTEREVRAIAENDFMRYSATERVAWVRLTSDQGLAGYGGAWVPVVMPRHLDSGDYYALVAEPWPLGDPGTMVVPVESDYDRRYRADPQQQAAARQRFQERVRKLGPRKRR